MFSNCRHAVYFNESNVIEIFITEDYMSSDFYYTRFMNFYSTYDFEGNIIIVFGNVKTELRTIEFCSSISNFSSGSNLKNDDSLTPLVIA